MLSSTTQRRVVVVDDSRTVQAMLDHAFSTRPDFQVVGFASDAPSAVEMIRRLKPDIVTIDLCMASREGAALLEMLSDLPALCKIVVSDSSVSNIRLTSTLMASGAAACIAKQELVTDPASFFKKIKAAAHQIASLKAQHSGPNHLPRESLSAAANIAVEEPIAAFPIPADEAARVDFVIGHGLADARHERRFDLVTKHVATVTRFPACLLTVIDRDTQWIKSAYGLEIQSTPRNQAFCNFTISEREVFVVPDAMSDKRFCSNDWVTGAPNIRSYVGYPVFNAMGVAIASLCVIDIRARTVSSRVIDQLAGLSAIVAEMIDQQTARAA
ncbi:response regulator [Sphingomonas sp. BAUL-RG-20F-R05-02]|uniref:response regulator n=1 Tax=Sphingomonas sp. BAUL-RG-20F-R05-02 TaxID=2914830 RepID=UPI001F5A3658|nr:response regulator [Sphingomonas sp. BAUL-RG-20F-R05-02]